MFRLQNSHHQAKVEHSPGTQKVCTLWDRTLSMYLDCVLFWPDDGCFTAETCRLEVNYKSDGSHPDVFSLGTINNKSFRQTQLVYCRVATCFDTTGPSSGPHYEPVNYNVRRFIVNWFLVKA